MSDPIRLVRRLDGPPAARPHWPEGIALAPFSATLAPKAHALLREAYRNGFGSVTAAFDGWWAATRHDPEFDAGLCFCAMAGETLVGFALCWTSAFVKDLVVHPDFRRRGIGEALLAEAAAAFAARGFSELALKVQPGNDAARRLYARTGFREA